MKPQCDCEDCTKGAQARGERQTVEKLTQEIARVIAENRQLRAEKTALLTELNDRRTSFGSIGGGDTALGGES